MQVNNKRTRADRNNPHVRLSRRMSEEKPDTNSAPRHIMDLTVTSESTAEEIASDMANKLCEEKEDLLSKTGVVLSLEGVLIFLFQGR